MQPHAPMPDTDYPHEDIPADGIEYIAGWSTAYFDTVTSTSLLARKLPAWHAVLAGSQSTGRGQHERVFVSDPGGLYVSAVVPAPGGPRPWVGFSLVVGWALHAALKRWKVSSPRLRWPNDLMVGTRKLGGILIEQGGPETLVVGIGINLSNRPWRTDPELASIATRVRDCAPHVPEFLDAASDVLRAVRIAHQEMRQGGLPGMLDRINSCWNTGTRVELELGEERRCTGRFGGIDGSGQLLVWVNENTLRAFAPHHIQRLRELPEEGGNMFSR
jgi:BirA family transcriptional regulator, biotin operon repressor / biotin---[acetyl-CoA-carboxylase] ligase